MQIFKVKIKGAPGKPQVHSLQAANWADAFSQAGNMASTVARYTPKGKVQYWVDGDGPFTYIR